MPVELISLLQVPNLGPKRAKLVYDELGVRTIDELRQAAEEHLLAGLPGLGPKAEQNILEGIEHLQSTSGRLLLHQAYAMQEEIAELMQERIPGLTITPAGSLRRMKETIGDIDILVGSEEPATVMEAFCSLPIVDKVLLRGDTKSSIVTRSRPAGGPEGGPARGSTAQPCSTSPVPSLTTCTCGRSPRKRA